MYTVPGCVMMVKQKQLCKLMLFMVLLNLAVRAVFVFASLSFGMKIGPKSPSYYSSDGYQDLGQMVAQGYGIRFAPDLKPSVFRAPVYPLLLGFTDHLIGNMDLSVLIINCLFAALGCAVLVAMFWYIAGRNAALMTGIIVSLYPQLIIYSWHAFTELIQFFFISLFAFCLLFMFRIRNTIWGAAAGAAFALEVLAKGWMLGFPVLLLPAFLLSCRKNESRGWKCAFAFCIVALIVICPWTVRNYIVSGRLIPITTGGGYQYLVGNRALDVNVNIANGEYDALAARLGFPTRTNGIHGCYLDITPVADDYFNNKAKKDVQQHPATLVRKVCIGSLRLWYLSPNSKIKTMFAAIISGLLLLAWGAGTPKFERSNIFWMPCALLMVYATIVFGVIYAEYRYLLPLSGLLIGFACTSFLMLSGRIVSKPADTEELK
ncbi:MAG: glycosyltransferase family 39 protein [Armatimonadota bacterium]|nr:glycosyltransferase family 39 protein [bacterium]